MNLKSAREPHFFRNVHGHVFAFTGTFWKSSRVSFCVHGQIFLYFHGHFSWFTGTIFWKCSRALPNVHGHNLIFTIKCSRALFYIHGHSSKKTDMVTLRKVIPYALTALHCPSAFFHIFFKNTLKISFVTKTTKLKDTGHNVVIFNVSPSNEQEHVTKMNTSLARSSYVLFLKSEEVWFPDSSTKLCSPTPTLEYK